MTSVGSCYVRVSKCIRSTAYIRTFLQACAAVYTHDDVLSGGETSFLFPCDCLERIPREFYSQVNLERLVFFSLRTKFRGVENDSRGMYSLHELAVSHAYCAIHE